MFINNKIKAAALVISAVTAVSGCANSSAAPAVTAGADPAGTERISIVCTVFPEYDWVKQILGSKADNADITYLAGSGTDLHNFQPTTDDIIRISSCDLFVYVGGESDKWVQEALDGAVNKDMKVVNLLDSVGNAAKTEEIKEGMQSEEEGDEEDGEEAEYDEHVWLSVKNAKVICADIAGSLCELDPVNAEEYKANLAAYTAELDALDGEFAEVISAAPSKTVVFGDRFPFRYFTDDYGLDYYAAFVGCSAETEASFETVVFLARKLDELGCKYIYTIENSDKSIAQTIINSTSAKDLKIAELNSLQSVSKADADSGKTYISLMRENCAVLKETLG